MVSYCLVVVGFLPFIAHNWKSNMQSDAIVALPPPGLPAVVRPQGVWAEDGLQVSDSSRRRGAVDTLRSGEGVELPLSPLLMPQQWTDLDLWSQVQRSGSENVQKNVTWCSCLLGYTCMLINDSAGHLLLKNCRKSPNNMCILSQRVKK